jgi:hypothetical protein
MNEPYDGGLELQHPSPRQRFEEVAQPNISQLQFSKHVHLTERTAPKVRYYPPASEKPSKRAQRNAVAALIDDPRRVARTTPVGETHSVPFKRPSKPMPVSFEYERAMANMNWLNDMNDMLAVSHVRPEDTTTNDYSHLGKKIHRHVK